MSSRPDPHPAPPWVRWTWDTPWLWLALIIPLFCVPLFIGLDRTDLENDEAIYSFAVETMLKDGDWLTPQSIPSETTPFLEKPPLKFWITYVPMRLGLVPKDEFGLRFMDALMGALAFLYVFGIGRRLAGPVCGVVAVLLLFSHNALLYQHGLRSNNMESAMLLVYAAGVYHFLAWRSLNPDMRRHIFAMSIWFAIGFMTKFVAALFLPVVLGLAALVRREDRGRLYRDWRSFVAAGLLAVVLIAPWFVYEYIERGPRLFEIMFGAHVFKRFTAYLDPEHLHPWHYYLAQIWSELEAAGTRTLITVASLLFVARVWRRRWIDGLVIVLWFALPMAAISAGTSKIYHYAYPYLPPLALAGGWLTAVGAARLAGWLGRPLNAFARVRASVLPAFMTRSGVTLTLTAIGFVGLVIGLATAAFDRLQATVAGVTVRNSSVVRPIVVAAVTWLGAAPGLVLGGALAAAALAVVLPLSAYKTNVMQTQELHRSAHNLRACLSPIAAAQAAAGRRVRGTWVEASNLSWVPPYYLRTFGQWQHGGGDSIPTMVKSLLFSDEPQFLLLTPDRYLEVAKALANSRQATLERAAALAGADVEALAAALTGDAIGLVRMDGSVLVLPGPYAACGHERVRLATD